MTLRAGDAVPALDLPSDDGGRVRLSDLKGRRVVLFFYPKDDTPGCTREACEFRDELCRFEERNVAVLGVSPDPVASHSRFKARHNLNFPLLADENHAVADRFGVWTEKQMFGRTFWGVERSTFLIDEAGVIMRVWRKVRPKGHAEAVVGALSG